MRNKDRKIAPATSPLRSTWEASPFGERLIVVALCGMVCAVPLVCLPGVFEYALLPRLFALHLCVAVACLGWLIQTRRNGSPVPPNGSSVTGWRGIRLPALCLMGVALLSSLSTTHPLDTAVELLNQAALLALFFVAASALTLRGALPVLWISAVAGLVVAFIGILQYHGLAFLNIPSAALPSATFGNRNFAAMYLVCAAPLSGLLFLVARRGAAAGLAGLSATLMGVYLVYTRTRSAWVGVLGALLGLGVLLILWPALRRPVWEAVRPQMDRSRRRLTLGFLALFLVLSALPAHRPIAALSQQGLPYLTETRADVAATAASVFQQDSGVEARLAAWRATLRMVMDHPLLGVGPGGWIRAYPSYDRGAVNTADTVMNTPHNDYLWIASEAGLLGLGAYLWLLTAGLLCLLRMGRDPDPLARTAALMFSLSLLASLGDAFFNFPREQPQAAMFLYLLFGIAAGATAGKRRPHPPPDPSLFRLQIADFGLRNHLNPKSKIQNPKFIWGRVSSVCPLLPYLLLVLSLTALELDRRRIGFDRHYLRAMAAAARPGGGPTVLAEVQRALDYGAFRPHLFNLKGHALQGLGRYDEAGDAYRQALTLAPHSWHAHNGLCAVAIRQKRTEEALSHGQAALSFCPTFAEAHNNLGLALRARGDIDGAIQEHRKAIDLKPDLVEARHNLAGALRIRGDIDGAVQEYRRTIGLKPDLAEAHYNLGLVLRAKGDLDGAIQEYRKAIGLKPDFPEAHNNLGSALARKGDLDGAIQEYRKAIGLKPDLPEARHNLDLLLKAQKDRTGNDRGF